MTETIPAAMTDFEAQAYATLLGAGIATLVSFILAWQANRATLKRDKAAKKEHQKSTLIKLMMKGSILVSDINSTMRAIDDMLRAANAEGRINLPFYAIIQPVIGSRSSISFSLEELEPLIEAKEYELVGELIEIDMRFQGFQESMSQYNQMRLDLKNLVKNSEMVGTVGTATLSKEEYNRVQPHLIEMDSLIRQAVSMGRDIESEARKSVARISPAARKYLDDEHFPKIEYADQTI